jgi:hypothetical protein
MCDVARTLFSFGWVERALLLMLPERATERAFQQDIKGVSKWACRRKRVTGKYKNFE